MIAATRSPSIATSRTSSSPNPIRDRNGFPFHEGQLQLLSFVGEQYRARPIDARTRQPQVQPWVHGFVADGERLGLKLGPMIGLNNVAVDFVSVLVLDWPIRFPAYAVNNLACHDS